MVGVLSISREIAQGERFGSGVPAEGVRRVSHRCEQSTSSSSFRHHDRKSARIPMTDNKFDTRSDIQGRRRPVGSLLTALL